MSKRRTGKRAGAAEPRTNGLTDFSKLGKRTDGARIAAAKADPDNPPMTPDWILAGDLRVPPPKKVPISLRVDPDVLEYFKSTSDQYQSSMNAVLRAYVEHHRAGSGSASSRPRIARKG